MSGILTTVSDFLVQYRDIIVQFFNNLNNIWIQAGILVGLAIFTLIGLFVFLKKFIKLFIVLGILGGILYFLYVNHYLDSLLQSVGVGAITFVLGAL